MPTQVLAIHERLGNWARQIRPRVASWPVRVVETRSASDLATALRQSACPLAIVDLDRWPARMLSDLERVREDSADALILVLDPDSTPGVSFLARELGATLVRSGFVSPVEVEGLLGRWLSVSRRRQSLAGWTDEAEAEPEPWDVILNRD
ncbi:MAG TPA: hypothetical protein VFT74_17020 [Isosphaeraceae bacterium]|nr:hypothetical protein [Isosphaeraceae bacterium]